MSLILNIDCSGGIASVSIAENGIVLDAVTNHDQKDHAAFLHHAIENITKKKSIELKSLAAIAVTSGPGSYTGLRVGMATAKGLCYALSKPFITIGTLNAMAQAVISNKKDKSLLYCPLIDARRMEVYTALFDADMNIVSAPVAMILDEHSFKEILKNKTICFFGSGAEKLKGVLLSKNTHFTTAPEIFSAMSKLSFEQFLAKKFTDLVDSEPLYIKDFHSSPDKSNKI